MFKIISLKKYKNMKSRIDSLNARLQVKESLQDEYRLRYTMHSNVINKILLAINEVRPPYDKCNKR